jgi:ribose transport system ATP-binding protein
VTSTGAAAAAVTQDAPPLFELRGIGKQFPGVKALDGVSFQIRSGEVHMLLGENGAGKSSLMKVLCGAYRADEGEFLYQGKTVRIDSPVDAQGFGIAVIFQEFSLVPYLDIAQNIFLGREPRGRFPGTVDRDRMHVEARSILDSLGLDLDSHTLVHTLGVAQQQMIEIAKALSQDAKILVLDEPTSALSERETERLFATIKRLKERGVAMVYISHRLAEVFLLGDRITVLRDGKWVGSMLPSETTPDELVTLMVGRRIDISYARGDAAALGEVMLSVRGMAAVNGVADIDLEVRKGEIVGLAGLVGAGRTEVARAIFGVDQVTRGEVSIGGSPRTGGPDQAAALGAALIPESRKLEGLALIRSVGDNLLAASLTKVFPNLWFKPARAAAVANERIAQLRIVTPGPAQIAQLLSGGNQQKIVIGKWLNADAKLFIFDEPTRGIDVGAKSEVFAVISELVRRGAAVLMISSELSEIVKVCDRSYVMREKRIVGHLTRAELSEESILKLAMHHG